MPRTRPQYPEQFRGEAVEPMRQGRTPGELAKSLGCSPQTRRNWRRQAGWTMVSATMASPAMIARSSRGLRRENTRLRCGLPTFDHIPFCRAGSNTVSQTVQLLW